MPKRLLGLLQWPVQQRTDSRIAHRYNQRLSHTHVVGYVSAVCPDIVCASHRTRCGGRKEPHQTFCSVATSSQRCVGVWPDAKFVYIIADSLNNYDYYYFILILIYFFEYSFSLLSLLFIYLYLLICFSFFCTPSFTSLHSYSQYKTYYAFHPGCRCPWGCILFVNRLRQLPVPPGGGVLPYGIVICLRQSAVSLLCSKLNWIHFIFWIKA